MFSDMSTGGHAKLCGRVWRVPQRLPVGSDRNYEQQCGNKGLQQEANNELHNSDKRNYMKWLVLIASKGHLL